MISEKQVKHSWLLKLMTLKVGGNVLDYADKKSTWVWKVWCYKPCSSIEFLHYENQKEKITYLIYKRIWITLTDGAQLISLFRFWTEDIKEHQNDENSIALKGTSCLYWIYYIKLK